MKCNFLKSKIKKTLTKELLKKPIETFPDRFSIDELLGKLILIEKIS